MVKSFFRGSLLPLLSLVLCIVFGCTAPNRQSRGVFKSESLQDSMDVFITLIDSIPNQYGNPTIFYVTIYEENGDAHVDFDAVDGWLTWPVKDIEASNLFCRGRYLGRLLVVNGNPKFKRFVYNNRIKLTKNDVSFLKCQEQYMLKETLQNPMYHRELILSPDGVWRTK